MKPALIVMAKTPKPGRAKRRLAGEIGDVAASHFYRTCLQTTLLRLSHDPRWRLTIAVTPDADCREAYWRRLASECGASLIPQGRGDLGARMHRLLMAEEGQTLLIGSDIPGVTQADIAQAFKKLGRADAVFGPAEDGGFWLVGMKRAKRMRPFEHVRWSSRYTLSDTLENFRGTQVAFASLLGDVDTKADHRLQREGAERLVPPRRHR